MNWKLATLSELHVIAFDDPYATTIERNQAHEEIKRRATNRRRHATKNYREKVHYR